MANLTKIPSATSTSQQIAMMNGNFQALRAEQVTKLYNDSAGIPIISIGLQSDGTSRIKVAKAGYDVTTATDAQLAFNSSQNTLKVALTGTTSITPPSSWSAGTAQTVTIPHGLSSVPAFIGYVTNPSIPALGNNTGGITSMPSPIWFTGASGATALFNSAARVDATNLYIDLTNLSSGTFSGANVYTWTYKYYLLQETAT